MAPGRRVLGRVVQQVPHDLLDVARLAGDDRQVTLEFGLHGDGRQLTRLVRDDPLEQSARFQRLRLDLQPATLDAAEHQQVLDEPMQPLRLRAHVLEQRHPRGVIVGPPGAGQDLGQPEDRRDRCPQLVADHVDERLPELAGPPLVGEQLVALLLEPPALGDVLAGPDHPDRLASFVTEDAARAVGPAHAPVRAGRPGTRG